MNAKIKMNLLEYSDCQRIHDASIEILKERGIVFGNEMALDIFRKHGFKMDGQTVFFDEKTVEHALSTVPKTFKWVGRDDSMSLNIGNDQDVAIPGPVGPINVQTLEEGARRGTLQDVRDLLKIYQQSKVVNAVSNQIVDPADVPEREKPLRMQYEIFKNSTKPICSGLWDYKRINEVLDLTEIAYGCKGNMRDQVYMCSISSALSPLAWGHTCLDSLIAFCQRGQHVGLSTASMTGVNAPARPYGALVSQNAEIMSGLVLTQLINPGNSISYGSGATMGYLKKAKYSCSSPTRLFLQLGSLDMAKKFYQIPARVLTFGSDSTSLDVQAGIESYENEVGAILGGMDWTLSEIGTLEGLLTISYEKTIVDEEIAERLLYLREGMNVSDDALSVDTIKEVGTNTYLKEQDTRGYYKNEWYPTVTDWDSNGNLRDCNDYEYVVRRANRIWKERLEAAPETLLDPELDKELKAYMEKAFSL